MTPPPLTSGYELRDYFAEAFPIGLPQSEGSFAGSFLAKVF